MGWFKKHSYPPFWNEYLSSFDNHSHQDLHDFRFVVFDTETTGLNPKSDRILSIGTVAIMNENIIVSDQLEVYLKQDTFNADTVKIHGLLKTGKLEKVSEETAIMEFLKHIKNAVLVAHHAAFDIAMVNACLKRLGLPNLKNKVVDTGFLYRNTLNSSNPNLHFSLDDLSKQFNIPQHDRHTASGDAYITAILFLKLIALLKQKKVKLKLDDLILPKKRIGLL
ncbi:3'-5' exonuclease [Hanstruepera neustonica]|uniref:3'-5' exonuclease n=1 Tax=Hanstruepera neustonica TaxID=1445657 RepID=A0A2K1DX00_9FLAO|nr:3'-5' exonuclease [Hanstruepera neustonica]PNQ72554.1 3'-5' exonuclease [Hanstruepera neustonica]